MDKRKSEKNYDLRSTAVDDLVDAQSGEVPEYSEEELARYRSKSKFNIPETLKILLIKAWFFGAVCYFILWGLGTYIYSLIDMLFILGIVLGLVTDLLTNNVIRFIEKTPGANDKWLLLPKGGMVSFFLNMIFGLIIVYGVYNLYGLINRVIIAITGATDTVPLGVEPILFGVFCMGFEMLLIGIRRLGQSILADAKAKVDGR